MAKIVKLTPKAYKISKELIAKFGEMIYHSEGVESVFVRINFKDGSNIGFKRCESDDEIESFFGDE